VTVSDLFAPHRASTCVECGAGPGRSAEECRAVIRAAPARFADVLLGSGEVVVHSRVLGGWTPVEHVVHLAATLDVARRELFRLYTGAIDELVLPVSPIIEADGLDLLQSLARLRSASRWFSRVDDVVRHRLEAVDLGLVLDSMAHEVDHHLAVVGVAVVASRTTRVG
jgi:hypothetical protein